MLNALHVWIIHKIRINIEEDWHVDRLASIQSLLLKAKALNLAEVRRHLSWSNAVGSDPDNIFRRSVRRGIERQGSFARQDSNFALLGREFPRQHVGYRAVERDADAFVVGDRLEPS